ncbi:amidase [Martelella alba]|uniref:Amidase n=1 Tax=Martelella alba TaxID=2590451 RepID=A0ABY2SPE3_9HYPH|nr:amidase [Martelella alba]TKI07745.1 amidase [Martelella alba]
MQDNAFAFMPYPRVDVRHAADGPLGGQTFAVKDLFDVAGYPTGGGSPHLLAMSGIKSRTAPAVERLLEAGARCVGKTHTNELAFSVTGKNIHYGTPLNGAAPHRIPGGSSSGSASAVSNGLCDFALGTDTGGSVRVPASYCGLFGLRPTHGRISLAECLPLSPSLDTVGYFTRDAELFARVGECLLGEDPAPLPPAPALLLGGALFAALSPLARQALAPALMHIAARAGEPEPLAASMPDQDQVYWAFRHIQGFEAWRAHGEAISRRGFALGPDVAARFAWAATVTEDQYRHAMAARDVLRAAWDKLLGNRVLILPTVPDIAPLVTAGEEDIELTRRLSQQLLAIAALNGMPQATLPLARKDGAPLGISLLGPRGSDLGLVRLVARIGAA